MILHITENKHSTIKEASLEAFKVVIRQRINMLRLEVVFGGDPGEARTVVIRGLREITGEIETEGKTHGCGGIRS